MSLAVWQGTCHTYKNLVYDFAHHESPIAQWLECPTGIWKVMGSTPVGGSEKRILFLSISTWERFFIIINSVDKTKLSCKRIADRVTRDSVRSNIWKQKSDLIGLYFSYWPSELTWLLPWSEEAKTWLSLLFVQCTIKQLLDSVFVISRIIKGLAKGYRLRLITLTSTVIILDITKTESNNCFIVHWTKSNESHVFASSLQGSNSKWAHLTRLPVTSVEFVLDMYFSP